MDKSLRIKELEDQLDAWDTAYRNGSAVVSDAEYDSVVDELAALDPTNKRIHSNFDNEKHIDGYAKAKHDLVTGTLAKCADPTQFAAWYKKHPGVYMMESKQDGVGYECKYVNGQLTQCVSRGDGFEGDDVTVNIGRIKSISKSVLLNGNPFTGSIRGEVQMKEATFKAKYSNEYANSRNCVSGLCRRLDGQGIDDLDFIAYDMQETSEVKTIKTEQEKLDFLKSNGFNIPEYKLVSSYDEAMNFRSEIYQSRDTYEYAFDGVVVKPEVIDYEDLKERTPEKSCAVKFDLDSAIGEVAAIEWSQSGKYFSPVCILKEPVALCGTSVQRASLANCVLMEELGIEIGSKVVVVKRGEIIPKIMRVIA